MDSVIEIKNLSKYYWLFSKDYKIIPWLFTKKGYYAEKKVLDNISFTIKKGERVGMIGKNGAGKSTIMKLIAGITYPTYGEIITKGEIRSLINLNAGFYGEYTGRQNIYHKGTLMGLSNDEIELIIDDILQFADLGEYIDLPIKTYSSGMAARLGFSLAVFSDPDILLIDEVLAVGDKNFRKKSFKKTSEMVYSGKTILFTSHSESQIKEFCNRVIYLKDGKIVFDGDVEEGLLNYNNLL